MRLATRALMVTVAGLALACGGVDGLDDSDHGRSVGKFTGERMPAVQADGTLKGLEGVRIWVQVANSDTRPEWCQRFRDGGMIVECEERPIVDSTEVFLKCPKLPDGTGEKLRAFLKRDDLQIYDWRDDGDYDLAYCEEIDAISLEIMD